ncbi:translation initiation factor eIF-2B subunit delta [Raphidocelis subcapitata]|uniref:Translation initiation factor eIF2B subunit delta n=1 Tax=Raphidocelis subcapitata TaxID=307507 RepID=A0A2V0P077_9CHLO|nr:translation initiation factor eIF-2B subunit delta [Raphidocelis subcapitata]|eukprot:GBF93276.1 translation initiation factor eIF-2B subunit delta [Raphidocelis subcapitata]
MEGRKRGDEQNAPRQTVVGFHVEGRAPSPSPGSSILTDPAARISSSPTPVIIPPQFQREAAATRAQAPEAQRTLDFSNAATAPPLTAVGAADAAGTSGRPPSGAKPAGGGDGAAAAADGGPSSPPPRGGGGKPPPSGGGPAAAAGGGGPHSLSSSPRGGGGGGGGGGGQAGEGGQQQGGPSDGVPGKKATTRAERRAMQEASRAAKAARQAAEAGGGGGGKGGGGGGGGGGGAGGGGSGGAAAVGGGGAAAPGGHDRPPSRAPSVTGGAPGGRAPAAADATASADGGAAAAAPEARRSGGGKGGGGGGGKHAAGASTELFAHLQQFRAITVESILQQRDAASMHPAVVALALQYADGSIGGGTARCVALLHALAQLIADYKTPPGKSLPRDLMAQVNASVDFLVRCRPLGVSMGNAIKFLKLCISRIDPNAPEAGAKEELLKQLADFVQEKVVVADRVLAGNAVAKIYDGDVVMTYSASQVVLEVLLRAHAAGRRFRVVIVDSRPECGGRQLLRRLLDANVPCTYTLLSGLSYAIKEVTKVILGAAAVLSNGTVVSRAGSASVAMMAAAAGRPVLVCCETLKFHERVQLDSITHNELGDPGVLARLPPSCAAAAAAADGAAAASASASGAADGGGAGSVASPALVGWEGVPRLGLLNLKYDAMPAEYVTMVVTEFGMIPPSSVPVILREWGAKMEEGQ